MAGTLSAALLAAAAAGATAAPTALQPSSSPAVSRGASTLGKNTFITRMAEYTRALQAGKDVTPGAVGFAAPATSTTPQVQSRASSSPEESTVPRTLSAQTATDGCTTLGLSLTELNDKVWAHWSKVSWASRYQLYRIHPQGSWHSLGTYSASTTRLRDTTVNPDSAYQYRLWAFSADGTTKAYCDTPMSSMQTDDGWGFSDAVWGTDSGAFQQDDVSFGMPASSGMAFTPVFSADGRQAAYATLTASDTWQLRIVRSRDFATVRTFDAPAGTLLSYPSFSPDGTSVVVSVADVATGAESLASGQVTGGSSSLAPVDGSTGYIQAVWENATTLLAAGAVQGDGLFRIPAAGGTAVPVQGTVNAGSPEVAPGGAVYYAADDGTSSTIQRVNTDGTVTTVVGPVTTEWLHQPRVSPDGKTLYYYSESKTDNTFSVEMVALQSGGDSGSSTIGEDIGHTSPGFLGFDVRQPKSKGLSDYVGDANPELLGKDTAGRLYAYSGTDTSPIGKRVQVGSGWNIFDLVVAPGDLTGDDRSDILGRKPDGTLWLYTANGRGTFAPGVQVGSGWSNFVIVAPGDFNGDGRADLLARDANQVLWLYPGLGNGRFGARTAVTSGWGGFNAIIGFGDANFDGKADILGRERSTGYLYLYPGNGTGGITGRTRLGSGWNGLNAFATPEFLGNTPGLLGRRADGTMLYYNLIGDGRFSSDEVYLAGSGWSSYQFTG